MQKLASLRFGLLLIALAWSATPSAQDAEIVVLTALPATYSVTSSLARETSIEVRNVPERGRRMNALVSLLAQRADRYAEEFERADAVVTIGKLWRDDPLFTAARMANVRVIDIDATKPWSTTLEGISVAMGPEERAPWSEPVASERVPSLYFWLSPANGVRMAEIIAADLMRLSPPDEQTIEANLTGLREELLDLKLDYELALAELPDVTLFALAPEFVYLTTDMGLYVDGYFLKQDIDWTAADLEGLTAYLQESAIRVVVHKWEPDDRIQAAVAEAGAQLVVLDPIDAGIVEDGRLHEDSYLTLMRENLAALHGAFAAANE